LNPEYIILHHSLTADGKTVSWGAIRRYHKSWAYNGTIIAEHEAKDLIVQGHKVKRPWRDVGYHFGIERVGKSYEILLGRMMNDCGAHCKPGAMNSQSLGICFVGNFDKMPPSKKQWDLGLNLVRTLVEVFNLPTSNVFGHRDFAGYKSCPGERFDIELFRRQL